MEREEDAGRASADPPTATTSADSTHGALPTGWPLLLFVGFFAIDYFIYRGVLQGQFVSDDIGYIVTSPYTAELSARSIASIFDPFGAASRYTANYAPVHLLLTAIERSIFAGAVAGFHLVNIAIHALNSTLLVALFLRSRLTVAGALLGGLVFAVHPANVEAVAWISQLKTNASLAFSLGALLALFRRPGLATTLFVLGLLTKASALFALPAAAAFAWARPAAATQARVWKWLVAWVALFGIFAIPQLGFFGAMGAVEVPAFADPWVHFRTIAAVAARYLVMAATGYGVSAFQEPPPALSALDPWWLAALPLLALLGARTVVTLRRRSEEAAYWVAAAAAFAPVSQYFPFLNPVADRYLYFILPGLIGGTLLVVSGSRGEASRSRAVGLAVAVAAALGLAAYFAVVSLERARLWTNPTLLYLDAARHYPEGGTAAFLAARRAAQVGDATTAVAQLRRAADNGIDRFAALRDDPGLAPIRDSPEFVALIHDLAGRWIERANRREDLSPAELRAMAHAHLVREEYASAEALLEQALRLGGPFDDVVRAELAELRKSRSAADARPVGESDRPQNP